MAALRYRDEHNKVGSFQKPTGSDDYHQILDFLRASHIRTPELDDGGIDDLPIAEIYSGMDNLGYVTKGKLTFFKNKFSPQWRFLVHTILHSLSTKSGSWDQFCSLLVVALICLSDGRKFNWSSYIFKGMVSNIGNAKKFLMYPRFLQTILAAMLPQDQEGKGAGVAAQAIPPTIPEPIPEPMPECDQPQDHLSSPPRQQTSDPIAPTDDEPFTSTNVEDEPLGGSFYASPPRSTQGPPTGHTSGGAEDLITLTALSFIVSTLVQKVNSLETKLKAHKKLFKDVVGKLVKQVKAMELCLLIPINFLGGASSNPAACTYDPTSDVPTTNLPTDVPSGVAPTGPTDGPSTVSPGSTTVPTSSYIPAAEPIPA
ncbi:hypothetical protein Tco_1445336, partial [Tanacetum coccineum]